MATFHHVGTAVVVDHEEDREAEREARLLEPALRNGYFETENRPRRDAAWGTTYTALSAVLLVGGVVSFFTRCDTACGRVAPAPGQLTLLRRSMGTLTPSCSLYP